MQHKYRGKRLDGGGWVEGSLVNNLFTKAVDNSPICYIIDHNKLEYDCWEDVAEQIEDFQVDPSTVGQAWEVKDKEGNNFYPNDLVRVYFRYKHDEKWYTEAVYRVSNHGAHGLYLVFVKLLNEDASNQYPICTSLKYGDNLYQDHVNKIHDRVAIQEKYSDSFDGIYYSNDITVIGNIHDNPDLLTTKTTNNGNK